MWLFFLFFFGVMYHDGTGSGASHHLPEASLDEKLSMHSEGPGPIGGSVRHVMCLHLVNAL